MSRLKFIATLNIALHPATGDGEILAAVRGAYRLLGGKSVDEFLEQTRQSPPSESELAIRLNVAEQELEGAVSYCNELKSQIINLQRELFQATASRDRVSSARAFKRRFAFIGRHPVMSFFPASIAIGVIASQGKDQAIPSGQNSSSPVSSTESHSSDTSLQRCSVVGGWKIEYNPRSEVTYMTKIYSSNTELIIGYNGVRYVMLLKTVNNVVRGNKYAFKVQFHFGSMLPKKENFFLIEGEGIVDYHSLLFSTLEPLFTENFTSSTEITFWYEDKMFETLWISNQRDAWQAMTACQKAHST